MTPTKRELTNFAALLDAWPLDVALDKALAAAGDSLFTYAEVERAVYAAVRHLHDVDYMVVVRDALDRLGEDQP